MSGSQARNFARVAVSLPVRLRPLDEAESRRIATRLLAEPSYREELPLSGALPGEAGHFEHAALRSLLERMDALEALLGRVAAAVGVEPDINEGWTEGEAVACSGAGLGALVPTRFAENTPLEVELTLLGEPRATVRALARTVSLVMPDGDRLPVGRFHLGLAFETIHEADREAVVRYTFRVQRAQLRDRRDSQDGSEE